MDLNDEELVWIGITLADLETRAAFRAEFNVYLDRADVLIGEELVDDLIAYYGQAIALIKLYAINSLIHHLNANKLPPDKTLS